ncbi:multi-sensor hybrid histidine kinase [Solidesulfovibrio fructosivorans JJ]]|uniref:histidine kinase n=1 Tax=Solidesulfovibrio fructosivorans JJ] TaxID=596151 RepID=E1JYK7_SOLFR|nr:GAF domain-containing protein [Solidesulfovibrio fructosivorans]EFL50591.1 multi-sensor hybrid histidine kinase [Solidesulfovibrio fructosivorans JJ]]
MTRRPNQQHAPDAGVALPLAAGLGTALALAVVLAITASWYREHLWLTWDVWGLRFFYIAVVLLALVPGLLVGLLVDRQARLKRTLRRRGLEIDAAQAELVRTNQALTALGAVNHELVRARDPQSFLDSVCRVLVEKSGYDLVWVGMAEPGPDKRVRIAARAGAEALWLEALDVRYDAGPRGRGPAATAIRSGRMSVVPDIREEAFFKEWPNRPAAMEHYVSALAFPLVVDGRVVGALSIYDLQPREFRQEEIELLDQMAADVSHGLHFLHVSAARERTAGLLRQALRVSAAMADTAKGLVAGDLDQPAMGALILERAMTLTDSPAGSIGLADQRTGRVDWLATAGPNGRGTPQPLADCEFYPDNLGRYSGPFAATLNEGTVIRQNEPVSLDAYTPCLSRQGLGGRFLAMPLRHARYGPRGLILLTGAKRPYAERDTRAVQRLATLFDVGAARLEVEEELVSARRRAEAANEAKTQFLANISHELRTPINGILGMAQLAILEGATGREAEYWQTVRDSTDKLVEIVDNLLELASVESGSLSPMLREFSLHRLLTSLRDAFSVRAGLAGLTLSLEIDPAIPDKLLGDPFRLRQIIANLLGNAIRFTPTGGVSMVVGPYDHRQPGAVSRVHVSKDFSGVCLAVTVTDTGVGIAKEKQTAIFESFTLGEECLTKRFGGTGMGLSIANRIAELLGGSIEVESQPGFGSSFTVTLPMWPVATPPTKAETAPPAVLPPLKFLVVEDEAVNRLALARSLRKLGHTVIEAGNGEEALRQLALERVDVVIMDVQMPVMDGLAAVAHIRNGEVPGTSRRLPVVALTAYALEGDRKRFLAAGMDEFVTKPCEMGQLLRAVAKVVET